MSIRQFAVSLIASSFLIGAVSANDGDGFILRFDVSGASSEWGQNHSDLVQIQIAGGFLHSNCNATYAGVKDDETLLVSTMLSAMMSQRRVVVQLDENNKYYSDRCTITDIFVYP